jgi:hypothetical protein
MTNSSRKWRFKRYIAKQKFFQNLAKKFENCIVGIGDWSQPGNSPIKGHKRAPIKDTIRHLYRFGVNIRVIQEYCTSKMCHNCYFKPRQEPKGEILFKFFPDKPDVEEIDDYKHERIELGKRRVPRVINGQVYPATNYPDVDLKTDKKSKGCPKVVHCRNRCLCVVDRDHNASKNICGNYLFIYFYVI